VRLHDLLDPVEIADQIIEISGEPGVDVRAVVHDSRAATPGALFACIRGDHVDGHAYAPDAVAAGAVACLVEHAVPADAALVRVASVRRALGPIAARFHGDPSRGVRVLGVTGTNGKTTTTYLLEAIARAAGERAGVIGTTGAHLDGSEIVLQHTTPEATELQALLAQLRAEGAQTIAMEVSSHALDQRRVDGTRYAAACFTNLTHDHLDYHVTLDDYFEAKARLFTPAFTDRAVVNIDDEHGRLLEKRARDAGLDLTSYGLESPADVTARDLELAADGTRLVLAVNGSEVSVRTHLVGRFNVLNVLAAAATASAGGFRTDAIVEGIDALRAVPGRMERVHHDGPFAVLVDYAHTPDALASVLAAARPLVGANGRLVVVFGCGGDRDRAKRPAMGEVASRVADLAIVTTDNSRSEDPAAIAREIVAGMDGNDPIVELDRRNAIRTAVRDARPGDVIVIAGKGHETGQTANGVTVPFDDRVVAREELEVRA